MAQTIWQPAVYASGLSKRIVVLIKLVVCRRQQWSLLQNYRMTGVHLGLV